MGYETRSKSKPQTKEPDNSTAAGPGSDISVSAQETEKSAAHASEAQQTPSANNADAPPIVAGLSSQMAVSYDQSNRSTISVVRSSQSTETIKARKLAAKAQHARCLADIESRKLELERKAADLHLQAELAAIEANSSRASARGSSRKYIRNTNPGNIVQWLDNLQVDAGPSAALPFTGQLKSTSPLKAGPRQDFTTPYDTVPNIPSANFFDNFQALRPNERCIESEQNRLVKTLETLASKPKKPEIQLPIFDGKSPSDWLYFKRIFLDTQVCYTTVENLARISASLRGAAREAVYVLLVSASNPMDVIDALEMRFGRPEMIVLQEINAIRALPRVSTEGKDLAVFACRVKNCIGIIKLLDQIEYVHSPEIFNSLISKLSPITRAKWYDYAGCQTDGYTGRLEMLSNFLTREVELQNKFGMLHDSPFCSSSAQAMTEKNIRTNSNMTIEKPVNKCIFCSKSHDVSKCDKFLTLSVVDRWQWVKKNKVCHRCLENRPHRFNFCKIKLPCSVGGCTYKHHALLHNLSSGQNILAHADLENYSSDSEGENTHTALKPNIVETKTDHENFETEVTAHAATTPRLLSASRHFSRPLLKVVAVQLSGPLGTVDTHALLDDGCTASFIDSEISRRIGIQGPSKRVRIDCVGGLSRDCNIEYVNFTIKGRNCTDSYHIRDARSIKNLSVNYRTAVKSEDISKYSYLDDLVEDLCSEEAQPMLIIGVDNWELTISTETRAGKNREPVAIRTALGWVLYGFMSSRTSPVDFLHHANTFDTCDNELSIESVIKEYYKLDSIGIQKKDHRGVSDTHALKILQETVCRLPDGHFETGLLWRPDITHAPNNYKLALSRFLSLESKMKADDQYAELYRRNIHTMLDKKYAEECTSPPVGITWYLPHFGVTHSHKPDKLRIVHDAAAKYEGVSLNSLLLPGPDLLQPLLAILMRFREEAIALTADIREMFPQVRIRVQDRDAQRFLWRDYPTEKIKLYRMSSMMFGACSSPCTALYVKNLNATELQHIYPEAAHATIQNVYMDDYIGSLGNVQKAAQLARDIIELNRKGGFEMRDWISNNPAALSLTPSDLISQKQKNVNLGSSDNISRVLGLIWQPSLDVISFNHGPKDGTLPKQLTKRDALSYLMRIYDPLGILGSIVTRGRIMFQLVWRQGLSWDDELVQADQKLWNEWFNDVELACQLHIPRCYSLNSSVIINQELHVFCDASELAYATVAYWRFSYVDGTVKLALIGSKSRVAPLKPTSIPRLELQAALIATRFATFICESHQHKPTKRFFWCDSLNVLSWLRSDARSFKPFVAHRVGEILEASNIKEWRWIPTAENVADDATRIKRILLVQESRWINGPSFLYMTEDKWPLSPSLERSTLEKKPFVRNHCHFISLNSLSLPLAVSAERLSSWIRLIRATARTHKFLKLLKYKDCQKEINAEDLQLAELHILRKSQLDCFIDDILCLVNRRPLSQKNRLYTLSPVIDEQNVLRLGGRINQANGVGVDNNMKNPIILDPKHPAVKLLIDYYHKRSAHANTETVVNEMRQNYWVINLRSAVRSVAFNCQLCRLRRAKPLNPPTGDLPTARLAHHRRPFSFVGLDYFGPTQVKIGRRNENRYVALYTCLVVRAVHLEVVHSLTTDAAIMSLRRFIARRGTPSEIWSDNGTAFVGADRVLRDLYGQEIPTFAANEKISWRFIPPSAPFMGGAWERLVRSIKTAIKVTLRGHTLSHEVLQTFLLEAENLVNTRPLTHVPADPNSEEALTPLHFILGASSGRPIPAMLSDRDMLTRDGWRIAVRLTDHFWTRWIREYLPTLVPRRGGGTASVIKEGDLVLVVDNQLPRGTWPRGRVIRVYTGQDGIIRVADVLTRAGPLKRPLKKLVLI